MLDSCMFFFLFILTWICIYFMKFKQNEWNEMLSRPILILLAIRCKRQHNQIDELSTQPWRIDYNRILIHGIKWIFFLLFEHWKGWTEIGKRKLSKWEWEMMERTDGQSVRFFSLRVPNWYLKWISTGNYRFAFIYCVAQLRETNKTNQELVFVFYFKCLLPSKYWSLFSNRWKIIS